MLNKFKTMQLTKNELIKFYSKKFIITLLFILMAYVFFSALLLKSSNEDDYSDTWKDTLKAENENISSTLNNSNVGMSNARQVQIIQQYKINEYMINHNIAPIKEHSLANFILKLNQMFSIIVILSIMASVKIISSEYTGASPSINSLFTLPCKRWKILLSKINALFIICISEVIILYLISILIGGIFFGFSDLNSKTVFFSDKILVMSSFFHSLYLNFFNLFTLIACSSFSLVLTIIFKNGIISTCAGIVLYYIGTQFTVIFNNYSWVKYMLFSNIHFQMYFDGYNLVEGVTPGFSVLIISLYVVFFYIIAYKLFNKKYN